MDTIETILLRLESSITNIDRRLTMLDGKLTYVEDIVRELPIKMLQLGKGCREAFQQTKTVIIRLKEYQESLGESLDEYGGVISASSFDWS